MLNPLAKLLSLFLLLSVTFILSPIEGQDQGRGRARAPEIIFLGKDETKWTEERIIPFPVISAQGIKEEPSEGAFDLKEDEIGPMRKMSPSTTQPGCAYTSRLTRGMASGDRGLYERGRYHYLRGDYEEAIQLLRRLAREYPGSVWRGPGIYWMGEAKFHQGKAEEAFFYFKKMIEEYPAHEFSPYALYSCGWVQLMKGIYDEGSRYFRLAYEKNPSLSIAQTSLFWSGYCLYRQEQYSESLKDLETHLRRHPEGIWRPEAEYLLGVNYFRLERYEEAVRLFQDFLRRFPRHPLEESARYALAWSQVSSGHYAEGRNTFEEILLTFPATKLSDPVFWGVMKTYLGDNEIEKAIQFYQRFLSQFLSSPWAEQSLFDIGRYHFTKKEYFLAASIFRQFLRTYPENDLQEWVQFMLGESHFNQKDYAAAIEAYRYVLWAKRSAHFEDRVFLKLGYANFFLKQYDEAIGYWERLLREFPDHPEKNDILYWLAESHLLKKDYRNSVHYVDQLKGDPAFYPKGLTSLGWYHFERGEWKEANQYFLKVAAEFPRHRSSPPVSLLIGQCYLNQNNYDQAKVHLRRLVDSQEAEGKERATYLLGWIAYREERFDEALDHFRTLRQFYPLSPDRDEAQYWTAWSHFRKKDFHGAIEAFQQLIHLSPGNPLVSSSLLKIGDAYYNLKQYGSAIQTYQQLVKDHGKSKEAPEADYGILLSLFQEKKYEPFVNRVEAFLKRYPRHPLGGQALMQLGEYYRQSQMPERALRAFQDMVRLYPQSEWTEEGQFRVALILKSEKRWAEASEEMEKFIKAHPKSHLLTEATLTAGELHLLLKAYPKALERFEWVLKHHPQAPQAKKSYLGMEEAYRHMGKPIDAEKVLKEYVEKFPQDEARFEAYLRLGLFYLIQKRYQDAVSSFMAASRSPEERIASQAQFKLGETHAEADNRESAILQFSRVLYLYPHLTELTEEALLKLGGLYMEEKRFSEARQVFQKLLEKTTREERRQVAKKMLQQIQEGAIPR